MGSVDTKAVLRARAGDKAALETVIESFRPLINRLCSVVRSSEDREDLYQDCVVAVIERVDSFDPRKRCKFMTHAYYGLLQVRNLQFKKIKLLQRFAHESDTLLLDGAEKKLLGKSNEYYCLGCGKPKPNWRKLIHAKGLCPSCDKRRHRIKSRFGIEGVCDRCGCLLGSRKNRPWCRKCGPIVTPYDRLLLLLLLLP